HPAGGALRFTKAGLFGLAAAVAGAVITYLVAALFHISAAIIAILVGYMVGKAVRKGSDLRGGLKYQLLAVFLTDSAVAWSYLPLIVTGFLKSADARAAAPADPNLKPPGDVAKNPPAQQPAARPVGQDVRPRGPLFLALLGVFAFVFSYAVPFLGFPK